jgi:methionyl-tRNA formyltransferase
MTPTTIDSRSASAASPMSATVTTAVATGLSPNQPARAVVFAYHDVGVHAIQVLLARQIEIVLVVTHQDNPNENIWFGSVSSLCAEHGIPSITPDDGRDPDLYQRVAQLAPDFIFSFYYRHMLPMTLLDLAKHGAFNLHGSLLPKYRGRVPVNWAVLHGESETGVSLHRMTAKADAGYLLGQQSVPILPDDTAHQVFGKLTVASEQLLWRVLPQLVAGCAPQLPNDISQGAYFAGRKPEDGAIDWTQSAQQVYNLHRAVAPPYPGAYTDVGADVGAAAGANVGTVRLVLARVRRLSALAPALLAHCHGLPCGLTVWNNTIIGICGDGGLLRIDELWQDGQPIAPGALAALLAGTATGQTN